MGTTLQLRRYYYETQQMFASNMLSMSLCQGNRIPHECSALLNMRNTPKYAANSRPFFCFVREHDGDFIRYSIPVVKLACSDQNNRQVVALQVTIVQSSLGDLTWKKTWLHTPIECAYVCTQECL